MKCPSLKCSSPTGWDCDVNGCFQFGGAFKVTGHMTEAEIAASAADLEAYYQTINSFIPNTPSPEDIDTMMGIKK